MWLRKKERRKERKKDRETEWEREREKREREREIWKVWDCVCDKEKKDREATQFLQNMKYSIYCALVYKKRNHFKRIDRLRDFHLR